MHDAEDGRVGPNAQRQCKNCDYRKPDILPHHAERVTAVTRQNLPVLARSGRENSDDRLFPELKRPEDPTALFHLALLLAKHAFHFALIIYAKIERQHANQRAKQSLRKRQGRFSHGFYSSLGQSWLSEKFLGARLAKRFFHALRFGHRDFASKFREQVIPAPLVV